jgi:hypothetical protein
MQFQVPQFIEIEDKIFGPLTIKQFIYITGGAGLSFIVYRFLPLLLAVPLIIVAIGFAFAMAFYQINNKPLIYIVQSAFGYYLSSKLYLWKKKDKSPQKNSAPNFSSGNLPPVYISRLSEGKLHDLSWNLDIKENVNPDTGERSFSLV